MKNLCVSLRLNPKQLVDGEWREWAWRLVGVGWNVFISCDYVYATERTATHAARIMAKKLGLTITKVETE